MSFDWSHYLDLAVELSDQAENSKHRDANLRSSISRAYYATFHISCQLLKKKWGVSVTQEADAHGQVALEFRKQRQHNIARKLTRMRADRNKADYDDTIDRNLEEMVETNIKRANKIISYLQTM